MSVTYPEGFEAAGVVAGLKSSGAPDLALVVNRGEAPAFAAVFTPNRFAAAPVLWTRSLVEGGAQPRAVVLNSGGANACTGERGMADALSMARRTGIALGLGEQVAVCSTGLIGEPLPMDKVLPAIDAAVAALSGEGGDAAARAIMTTDTRPKTVALDAAGYRVGGMAKGAGMLAPELATMLVVLTTDAVLDAAAAQAALAQAVDVTFNRLDSDGCMSTNDTVVLLASGASGVAPDAAEFTTSLARACFDLSKQLLADAEGASHDIAVSVVHAPTEAGALAVARAVARSNLFKCAVFGGDPNWGRAVSAAGTVPEAVCPYDPGAVDVSINGVKVCRGGGVGEPRSLVDLTARDVEVVIDLAAGGAGATVYTSDLTYDYVKENAEYPT